MGTIIGSISTQVMCTMSQMADIVAEHTGKAPGGQSPGLCRRVQGGSFARMACSPWLCWIEHV
jgi:hypothetical protein